ncbi:MAG: protein CapL [Bacteroidota bacterium]|jgi:UDP-N-acetyl-D-galactosamine dehydrogenase
MKTPTICILGLGYVGLPLAVEFSKKYKVVGFDINQKRIDELNQSIDHTSQVDSENLKVAIGDGLIFTSEEQKLKDANIFIVTVPTPIDENRIPDLRQLLNASSTIGRNLKKRDYVIYESTTYPGCTEEDCVPVLEKVSGLKMNEDFFVGYSPERINPGDKVNTLTKIKKVTSGSTPEAAAFIDELYASIITAGTHKAPSIRVAEASKAIENAQRDINISFVNELALIFDKMGINTQDVLEAASTKWNFLKFTPGLVGGHCISVDPYYLAYKSTQLGYTPKVITSGREVNEFMPYFVAEKLMRLMLEKGIQIKGSNILILGATFKENTPDTRNTKVHIIIEELKKNGANTFLYDPLIKEFCKEPMENSYDSILILVRHIQFAELNLTSLLKDKSKKIIFDLKSSRPDNIADAIL